MKRFVKAFACAAVLAVTLKIVGPSVPIPTCTSLECQMCEDWLAWWLCVGL